MVRRQRAENRAGLMGTVRRLEQRSGDARDDNQIFAGLVMILAGLEKGALTSARGD